ncbi:MAG TPA: hypothetical protein VGA99_02740, partial [bacterium]
MIVGLVLQANAFAEDWVSRYLQRPASDFTVADSLMAYSSSTRGVISLNGVWEARKSGEHGWNSISVPGAYEFEGEVEFRRIFSLDSSVAGKAIKLVALGVNNRCSVIINNSFVGSHSGGQTSFTIDIPPEKLRPDSPNEIRITVDNTLLPRASLPLRHSANAPCNYGGIFRDIFLIALPSTGIE